jgi:hypothetical protein
VGDGAGLENLQAGGLGEGWGDTHAMLLAVREADAAIDSNAGWTGTFALSGWVTGGEDAFGLPNTGYYFGVRRVPYSTDMQKDPLTFRHIADGQALVPDGSSIPIAFGADGADNHEVHNTGEVWATMLWECYAALLRDTQGASPRRTFDQARAQWKDYLVAAYKLTPVNPTFLEARDAVLAAAYATDPHDYLLFWQAFAKRGAGVGAVGPDKWFSPDNNPVVESYETSPHVSLVGATFASGGGCSDGDAYLDAGEAGTLTLTLQNDGATPLAASTATVSSDSAALTFPSAQVSMPAIAPGASATVGVGVALAARGAPTSAHLVLTFASGTALAGTALSLPLTLDRDEVQASSASDDFTTLTGAGLWTPSSVPDGVSGWVRQGGTVWAPDLASPSDLRYASPPLDVGDGNLVITFRHRFGFEGYLYQDVLPVGYDFGTVEVSDDAGATWTDVGADAYNGYVLAGDPPDAVAIAFVFQSDGYPGFITSSLDLGTAYAGKTVQVRFRVQSDVAVGADGWTIDSVTFGGITNRPFPSLHLDAGKCADGNAGGTTAASSGCASGGTANLTSLLLALGVLALRWPRRRRVR